VTTEQMQEVMAKSSMIGAREGLAKRADMDGGEENCRSVGLMMGGGGGGWKGALRKGGISAKKLSKQIKEST